jgi:hypothetical protein
MLNIFKKKKSGNNLPDIPAALKDSITINYLEELKKFAEKNVDAGEAGLEAITTQIILKEMKETTEYLNKRYCNSGITPPEGREAINTYLFYRMMKTQDGQNAFIRVKKYLADIVAGNGPEGTNEQNSN